MEHLIWSFNWTYAKSVFVFFLIICHFANEDVKGDQVKIARMFLPVFVFLNNDGNNPSA